MPWEGEKTLSPIPSGRPSLRSTLPPTVPSRKKKSLQAVTDGMRTVAHDILTPLDGLLA